MTQIAGLEEHLKKHEFVTGKLLTYTDIVIFIEIDTIKTIYGQKSLPTEDECPKLNAWFSAMKKKKELLRINQNFYDLVRSRGLKSEHYVD